MFPKLLMYIVLVVYVKCYFCEVFRDRPKIKTTDGDLTIKPGRNKNIYLKTNGPNSAIFLNDVNLLHINQTIIKSVTEEDPRENRYFLNGVLQRLQRLESASSISNIYVPESIYQVNLNEINDRLVTLERRILPNNKDTCLTSPCFNGGTCLDLFNKRHCLCPSNWKGDDCREDVNECTNFAGTDLGCQNGATCINTPGSYTCSCNTGWFGVHCTKRSLDCSGSNFDTCGHGTCVSTSTGSGIKCICDQGWTTNGTGQACLADVDECNPKYGVRCSTNPKVNCINLPGTFWCGPCPTGYDGDGYVCSDIDECLTTPNGGCSTSPRVSCYNTIGSRICGSCPHGYEGDGIVCTWKGSCNINNGNCYPGAQCVDSPGIGISQCICPDGMEGDGIGITGCYITGNENITNNCNSKPCGVHGICHVVRTGYTCICLRGHTGVHCENQLDYCNSNPCLHNGRCISDTSRTKGYRCECTAQFSGDRCQVRSKTCGGVLDAEEGSLAYPNNNHSYSDNSRCAWIIHTSTDKVINVTFTKFNLEKDPECSFDFLQIHDGRSSAAQLIDRFCGNEFPKGGNIISSHNNLYFWFRSDASVSKDGFALHWTSIKPICGGTITASSHGQISSPGSPGKYPPNRDCYWHISAVMGKRIQIHFFALDIEIHANCSNDFIAIYDGEHSTDPVLSKLCNSTIPPPIQSAGSMVLIHFHSDAFGSGKGFQLAFAPIDGVPGCGGYFTADRGEISSPSYDGKYLNAMLCEYKIKTSINTVIKIDFKSFGIESSFRCRYDYLKIYDGPSSDSRLIGTYCGSNIPRPYTASSNYLFMVFKSDISVSSKGFKITYQALCRQTLVGDSGILKSPGYPFRYPANKVCDYLIVTDPGRAIQLNFQDFDVEDNRFYNCEYDHVEIRDGPTSNSTLMGKFCGSSAPSTLISTHNYMFIRFRSDMSISGTGFYANYTTINRACGGIYKNTTGLINYPSDGSTMYKKFQTCTWVLQAPPGMAIKLSWNRFDIEKGYHCSSDYLEIFEVDYQNNNQSLGKFCGSKLPPAFMTFSNEIILKFVSDQSVQSLGFSVSYSFLNEGSHCGGTIINSHGQFNSPNWPKPYLPNQHCKWIIKVPQGQQIKLNISNFDLERSIRNCDYGDYLEIKNGASEKSPSFAKFCGKFKSKIITSATNSLSLIFHSDFSINGGGFQIAWDVTLTGCGGALVSPSGSIASPNYPDSYDDNAECFYKVIVSSGSRIKFTFTDLDLERSENCSDDFVEIFDGRDETSLSLGKFCSMSSMNSKLIQTSSNNAFIKFRSDVLISSKGFLLNYETLCVNNLTGNYGVIESPGYPNQHSNSLFCSWSINVPRGNRINITFTDFNVFRPLRSFSLSTWCVDYLQMKESSDDDFHQRLCGNQLPPAVTSTTETYQIRFVTRINSYSNFRLEWVRYGCGGHIQKSYGSLSINNEKIPSDKQIECEWVIETEIGTSVGITFNQLYMLDTVNCTVDAIEVYNGKTENSPRLSRFCHNSVSMFYSTSNFMLVKLIKQSTYNDVYFTSYFDSRPATCGGWIRSQSGFIHSKNYPKNYDSNLDCIWKLEVPSQHKVLLNFEDVDLYSITDQDCNDSIRIYDDKQNYTRICPKTNTTSIISKTSILNLQFISDSLGNAKGFKANFTTICGALLTNEEGFIMTDEFASKVNMNCIWSIIVPTNKKIALTFTHISIPMTNENVTTNKHCPVAFLKVYDGSDVDSPLLTELCGRRVPQPIISHGSAITLELGTYISSVRKGFFKLRYTTLSNSCGGEFTSEEGYIASPKYPLSYPPNTDCEWILRTSQGNRVYIVFEGFDLENSEHCNEDYLEIRENDATGKIVGIYCGNEIPTNTTTGTKIYMKFHSNTKVPGKGFLLRYGFLHGNNIFITGNGQVESPMFPHNYEGAGTFSWRLMTNGTKKIDVRIDKLEIPTFSSSCQNALIFYDGYDEEAPILETLCGIVEPNSKFFTSTSNVILVKFIADTTNAGSLFSLSYSESNPVSDIGEDKKINCGNNKTQNVGPGRDIIFNTPNYPNNYNNSLYCQWIFSGTSGHRLSLQFIDFELEETPDCFADYVTIYASYYNKPAEWQSVEDKFCLAEKALRKISPKGISEFKIIFKSDTTVVSKGFKAKVVSECGGLIIAPSGVFGSEVADINFFPLCEWTIKVRVGRTIKMNFEYFNVSHNTACNTFVTLKNGDSDEAPLLGSGKYCGYAHENRSELVTSSNSFFVSYKKNYNSNLQFRIRYQENNIECGFTSTLDAEKKWVTINSPSYPSVPPPYTECIWTFTGPPGEILRVDFIDRFDVNYDQDCTMEAVEIRDGSSEIFPRIGRYCGKKPGTAKSSNNKIFIKYITQLKDPRNGFSANISVDICGGTIVTDSGEIISPGFPNMPFFPPGTVCEWHLIGTEGFVYEIKPLYINLPRSQKRCGTNITIEEHPSFFNQSEILDTICNTENNGEHQIVKTSSNKASIKLFMGKKIPVNMPYLFTETNNPTGFRFKFSLSRAKCGGQITTPEGYLTTPGYPRYTSLRICRWLIEVPNKLRKIKIEIIDADELHQRISFVQGSSISYRVVQDLSSNNKTIVSTGNKIDLLVFSHDEYSQHRFKAKFTSDEPISCGGNIQNSTGHLTLPTLQGDFSCEWSISVKPNLEGLNKNTYGTIFLNGSMKVPNREISSNWRGCSYFDSKFSIEYAAMRQFPQVYCKDAKIEYGVPTSNVKVIAFKNENQTVSLNLNWKWNPCGGELYVGEDPVNVLENIPSSYNDSINCVWIISSSNRLEFKLEGSFQFDCNNEYIVIKRGRVELRKYCKDQFPQDTFLTLLRPLYVHYHSQFKNTTNLKLMVNTHSTQCGGNLFNSDSYFSSPNYPKNYFVNQQCVWDISAPIGFKISLQFVDRFAIEYSLNCTKDVVIIYDWEGKTWTEIGRYCGRELPPVYNSTINKLRVLFRSDDKTNLDGFKAKWTSICGGLYTATQNEQTMYSPGYPLRYSPNLNCDYKFVASTKNQKIIIKFTDFDLEGPYPKCKYDNVTIINDGMDMPPMCGVRPSMTYVSETITLNFRTDRYIQKKGFRLVYSIYTCGGNITNSTEITSTPSNYEYSHNCTWYIQAPETQVVVLKLLNIRMDNSVECYGEYLGAYEGLQVNEKNKLALLCGYINSSTIIESSTNKMTLNYYSTVSEPDHGFKARVTFSYSVAAGCGGVVTLVPSNPHLLESPLIGGSSVYENFLHCHWKVLAPPDQVIKIAFTSFHIAPCYGVNQTSLGNKCDCDSVEIRDGLNPTSYLIGSYCGHNLPSEITSSSNKISIRFLTDGEINSSGFKLTLTSKKSLCGQSRIQVTKSVKQIKSPGYELNNIPRGIHCLYYLVLDEYETMHLSIKEIDLRSGSPDPKKCNKDKLVITFHRYDRNTSYGKDLILDGEKDSSLFLHTSLAYSELENYPERLEFCGHKQAIDLYLQTSATISIQTDPEIDSTSHKGVVVEFSDIGFCGRNYSNPQGRIHLDNGDDDSQCLTLITSKENSTISLYFLTTIPDYWNDDVYLDIFDGKTTNSPKLVRVTGDTDDNLAVFSTGQYLLILNHNSFGFDLNYLTTNKGRGCGGKLNNLIGKISSPLYPEVYRHRGSCEWELETPHNTRLRLHFVVFDLGVLCDQNYVQVIDSNGLVVNTYCSEMPADYTMQDNYAKIVFTTTRNNGGTGWVLEFAGVA